MLTLSLTNYRLSLTNYRRILALSTSVHGMGDPLYAIKKKDINIDSKVFEMYNSVVLMNIEVLSWKGP